jgi:PadR family transcriptional regulator, regulatory protein PadR
MNTDNAIQQMRKGVLELCTLATIASHDEIYPGDIRLVLKDTGMEIAEGTLYPLLLRLKTAGHLTHKYIENQSAGPPRKYYKITDQGRLFLDELRREWNDFTESVDKVVNPTTTNDNLENTEPPTTAKKKKKTEDNSDKGLVN